MMQAYAEYKDSGVDWLGEIPAGWEVQKAKWVWREIEDRSENGTETLLSVSQYHGVVPRKGDSRSEELSGYKSVYKDHLVTNIMLAWMGGLGVSNYDGIVSPAYSVYRLKEEADPHFLGYLYRTSAYLSEFARRSTGVVPSRWRMYTEDFGQVLTILPPLPEQTAIAEFLDDKTAKIEALVGIKRRQIELLAERKQILIQNAVTKGLNPAAPMKDSGVDWIGDIPTHWEVKPLKRVMSSTTGFAFPSTVFCDDGIPLVRIGDLSADGRVTLDTCAKLPYRYENFLYSYGLKKGDILMAMTGGTIGKTSYYSNNEKAFLNQRVCRFIPDKECLFEQLALFWMKTKIWKNHIDLEAAGGAQPNISDATVLEMVVALSPNLSEQQEIAEFVTSQTLKIDAAITIKQNQITKLNEYKTTLINAAVTGKIKVA